MSFSDFYRSTDVVLSSGYYVAGKSGGSGSWRGVLGNNELSGKVYFEISVTTYDGLLWLGIGTLAAAMNASPATGGLVLRMCMPPMRIKAMGRAPLVMERHMPAGMLLA